MKKNVPVITCDVDDELRCVLSVIDERAGCFNATTLLHLTAGKLKILFGFWI